MLPHFTLFGHTFKTYGLTFIAAYAVAYLLLAHRARELGKPRSWIIEAPIVATLAGLVGARLYYLAGHPGDWSSAFDWNGGNAWYGGFFAATVAILAWRRWRGIPVLLAVDSAAFCVPFVQAIGRMGCQFAGDGDYGVPSNLPWAMGYPHGSVPTPPGVRVHPTPIYESLALLAIGLLLWRLRDRTRPGALFAAYALLAGLERFLVEFIRRNPDVLGPFTAAQLWSAALMLVGGVWLGLLYRRHAGLALPAGTAPVWRDAAVSAG